METTVPPPDQKEMAELERMAIEHDSQALDQLDAQPETRVPAEQEEEQEIRGELTPDSSETNPEPDKKERKRDAQGRFLKEDGSVDPDQSGKEQPTAEVKPDAQPETPYTKATKERIRKESLLKNFEQEKAQARAEIAAERRLLEQQRAEIQQRRNAPRYTVDGQQATAEQLASTAQNLWVEAKAHRKAGNYEEQDRCLDLAEKAQVAANEAYQYEAQLSDQQSRQSFAQQYHANLQAEFEKDPELQNPDAPIHKYLGPLLEKHPIFGQMVDGFTQAKQVATWQMRAELVSELEGKLKKAEAEVSQFRRNTSLGTSTPSEPASPKTFDQMTPQEQMAWLEREAERADAVA